MNIGCIHGTEIPYNIMQEILVAKIVNGSEFGSVRAELAKTVYMCSDIKSHGDDLAKVLIRGWSAKTFSDIKIVRGSVKKHMASGKAQVVDNMTGLWCVVSDNDDMLVIEKRAGNVRCLEAVVNFIVTAYLEAMNLDTDIRRAVEDCCMHTIMRGAGYDVRRYCTSESTQRLLSDTSDVKRKVVLCTLLVCDMVYPVLWVCGVDKLNPFIRNNRTQYYIKYFNYIGARFGKGRKM